MCVSVYVIGMQEKYVRFLQSSVVFLQALYMFLALAIVCDDFFVMSLEKICEVGLFRSEFPVDLSNTAVQREQQNLHYSSSDPL